MDYNLETMKFSNSNGCHFVYYLKGELVFAPKCDLHITFDLVLYIKIASIILLKKLLVRSAT